MIIEGAKFLLHTLKFAVYPYPELVSAGWSHTEAGIFTMAVYIIYLIIFVALWQMEQERRIKSIE